MTQGLLEIISPDGALNPTARLILQTLGTQVPFKAGTVGELGKLPAIDAFYHSEGDDVFTLSIISEKRFVRFEVSKDSNTLSVVLPLSSVSRTVLETAPIMEEGKFVGTGVRVAVEITADQRALGLEEMQIPSVDENGEEGVITRLVGFSSPSGWSFYTQGAVKVPELVTFYQVLSAEMGKA